MVGRSWLCMLTLVLFACGGRTGIDDDTESAVGGVAGFGGGATLGGSSSYPRGGNTPIGGSGITGAVGGSGGTETCMGSTVTFQAVPSSGASWCLGQPGQCANASSIGDAMGALWLSALCTTDCQTCKPNLCHSLLCAPPTEVTALTTLYEWDGTYYEYGTSACGSGTTSCATSKCAKPGLYSFKFAAFLNPAPGTANGCSLATSATPVSSITGTFTYPTDTYVSFGM